jgi:hypothetical protein
MSTRHIRGEYELEPFPSINSYDFDFQSYSYASKTMQKILPGDRLITNCTYDTRTDSEFIHGGIHEIIRLHQ